MKALRFSNDEIDDVSPSWSSCTCGSTATATGEWTDSAVRRYVRDAGATARAAAHADPGRLHDAQPSARPSDCARTYDDLEARIARLAEEEELASIRPDLDGKQIMAILGIEPGPLVGKAYRFLLERRIDRGPDDRRASHRRARSSGASQLA